MKFFRFISVTRSRTVGRTPWTGDQLVAMPLLTVPGDCDDDDDDGEVGGMNGFGRGNQSTRRKPAPTPLCPPQIPSANPGRRRGKPATNRFSYGAALYRGIVLENVPRSLILKFCSLAVLSALESMRQASM
jgi:hypothetical protein